MRLVQRGYRLGRRRGGRGRGRQVRCVGFHVSETQAARSGCVCGTKVRVFTPPSPVESRVTTRRRVLRGAGSAEVRLRLHRRQQGPQGPARRQGRQPRRDDQPRAAGAARLHHHHRGVPALPGARARARPGCADEVERAPATRSSRRWASKLGDADDPLLVSVRSGAKFSMPGMMETVLNIGLQRRVGAGPGQAGRQRAVRLGLLPPADPDVRQDRARHRRRALRARARRGQAGQGHQQRPRPRRRRPAQLVDTFKEHRRASTTGRDFPQDPREQMDLAIRPSSTPGTPTAPSSTAARSASRPTSAPRSTSCAMVFGNLGMDSGTGVAFTRDPATGAPGRLRRLPAERPGRGRRRRHPQHRPAAGPGAASTRRPTTS